MTLSKKFEIFNYVKIKIKKIYVMSNKFNNLNNKETKIFIVLKEKY